MDVTLKLRVDDNARVLTAGAEDRAVLPVQVDVQHNDDGVLVLALENFRFELHDANDQLLEVLTARPMSVAVAARELGRGEQDTLATLLVVRETGVRPNTQYRLAAHAYGQTQTVDFKFL